MEFPQNADQPSATSTNIRIWEVQDRRSNPRFKRPWLVRWRVADREFSRAHRTKSEADRFRRQLFTAQERGDAFDLQSGQPTSWMPTASDMPLHVWARRWLAEQWDEWQPRTRRSNVEALARFVPLLARPAAPAPANLRRYLTDTLPPATESHRRDEVEAWLSTSMRSLAELDRILLADADHRLGLGDQGQQLAATTSTRFRTVAHACIRRAVDLEILSADPWPPTSIGRARRKSNRRRSVELKHLPDPSSMRSAIDAMRSDKPGTDMYRTMTAVVYYAGLRPSEVIMMRPRNLRLPDEGWGSIDVVEADIDYDQPGEPKTGPRTVPIPPVLAEQLRTWIREHELVPDDLLFRTINGTCPRLSNWGRSWRRATRTVGLPSLRVYDCRHAAATTWLRAGVPLGEVARRLGHTVDTLVNNYVGALSNDSDRANILIDELLEGSIT